MTYQTLAFIIGFSICLGFVLGCIWASTGKKNKEIELDESEKFHHEQHPLITNKKGA